MPYALRYDKNARRPWAIIAENEGRVVGRSKSREKALASIAHREQAEKK